MQFGVRAREGIGAQRVSPCGVRRSFLKGALSNWNASSTKPASRAVCQAKSAGTRTIPLERRRPALMHRSPPPFVLAGEDFDEACVPEGLSGSTGWIFGNRVAAAGSSFALLKVSSRSRCIGTRRGSQDRKPGSLCLAVGRPIPATRDANFTRGAREVHQAGWESGIAKARLAQFYTVHA